VCVGALEFMKSHTIGLWNILEKINSAHIPDELHFSGDYREIEYILNTFNPK
jgi:hypothetical protein